MNDPTAREQLLKLGVRTVPVLARSDQYIFCQNLEDVAEFVGLQGTGHTPLPPGALFTKWTVVLRAAQRYIRQIPNARLNDRAIDNRDRSIRLLSHHIFRIGEAFLETAIDGVEYWVQTFYGTPPMHQLFERSTWHSAQHTRQMIAVLERFGIEPDVRLTAEDLAGLPLPEGIWE